MTNHISTAAVSHLALTITDLQRALDFYTGLLGFQKVMELSPTRVLISNGGTVMALTEAPDPAQAIPGDRFSENRVGLDHLSFNVGSRDDLEAAARLFDERDVSRGEIKDLGPDLGMYVMAFRDPDNIQLELTAPYAQ
jgi:catechol 2,3-dioxygenase-like lactoylglutathione lyase family enzyme